MFCINCGATINDGEMICKGCSGLGAEVRDELLAMSEKTADLKCEKCGGAFNIEHYFCNNCGSPISTTGIRI